MPKGICSIEGCETPVEKRGWCSLHYQRWRKHGDPFWERTPRICSVDGCEKRVKGHGWCLAHYERWRRHGDPLGGRPPQPKDATTAERFQAKTRAGTTPPDKAWLGPCTVWTASRNPNGYGQLRIKGRATLAYRWAWEQAHGTVPDGLELDHLCRNRACVNPNHLELVTHQENMRRGAWATKPCCPRGHPYDEANTGINTASGGRYCRICHREEVRNRARARGPEARERDRIYQREWKRRKRAAG